MMFAGRARTGDEMPARSSTLKTSFRRKSTDGKGCLIGSILGYNLRHYFLTTRRSAVRVPLACLLVAIYFVFCSQPFGQSVPPGAPVPRNASDSPAIIAPTAPGIQSISRAARTDTMDLQNEAKQILELSRSIQLDMDAVNRGLLP